MVDEPNEQPKFPPKVGPFDPIPFDYGLGKRMVPRRKRRPGEPQPLADGHTLDPHSND